MQQYPPEVTSYSVGSDGIGRSGPQRLSGTGNEHFTPGLHRNSVLSTSKLLHRLVSVARPQEDPRP